MKLSFTGTMEEFRAVFGRSFSPSADEVLPSPEAPSPMDETEREYAKEVFRAFCQEWTRNFHDAEAEQPDRVEMMRQLGTGRHVLPLLKMIYEKKSLQRVVEEMLGGKPPHLDEEVWLDYVDGVSASMVQVCHVGFPDLNGTYDYSTKWRRVK